jgi:hypothetical protein
MPAPNHPHARTRAGTPPVNTSLHETARGVQFHQGEIWEYRLFRNKSLFPASSHGDVHVSARNKLEGSLTMEGHCTLNVLKVWPESRRGVRSGFSGDLPGRLRFSGGDTSRSL